MLYCNSHGETRTTQEEVKAIYNGVENFDLRPSAQQLDNVIHKYNLLGDKRISYDEFAIIMLTIAKW